MDKDFIMATARTAEQQILWSINKWEYMSWGVRQKAAIEYEGMATLALRVSGAVHKGWVYVSLNEGMDCYEVRLLNVARTKVKRTLEEVYCDNLGEVLDGLIERKAEWTDAQYKDKAVRDSARKMGMEVIDVSKKPEAEPMESDGVRYRPATLDEIEGRDTDLYMQGERVWVMMICRSETIGEDSEPKLDYIWLTNGKKVQVEDLQVIDNNNNEPNKEDKTMRLNINNNESENVQAAAQVTNEVESVNVGEVTLDSIMPTMTAEPVKVDEYTVKDDKGNDVKFESVAPAMPEVPSSKVQGSSEPTANTGKAKIVVCGVPKPGEQTKTEEKPKVTLKKKTPQPEAPETCNLKPETLSRVRLVTYTTKRGETAPRIVGFTGEDDPRWKPINDEKVALIAAYNKAKKKDPKAKMTSNPFGPAWLTDREGTGEKTYCMTFGVRYMDVARALCEAYNTDDREAWKQAEQAVRDTKAGIVSGYQAEREARRAERKAERAAAEVSSSKFFDERSGRAERQVSSEPAAPAMSDEDRKMFDLFKRFMAGDKEVLAMVNAKAA